MASVRVQLSLSICNSSTIHWRKEIVVGRFEGTNSTDRLWGYL